MWFRNELSSLAEVSLYMFTTVHKFHFRPAINEKPASCGVTDWCSWHDLYVIPRPSSRVLLGSTYSVQGNCILLSEGHYFIRCSFWFVNPLKPNDPYKGRTATLIFKRCILYIYSTNIGTEYFIHGIYSTFFPSKSSLFHNSKVFGSCIIHILYTGCAKIKRKIIPAPKG